MKTQSTGNKITMAAKKVTLEEAKNIYLKHCKSRNLSVPTIGTYENHIRYFCDYYKSDDLAGIGKVQIQGFIQHQKDKGLSSVTIFGNLCSIRAFFNWCMSQGYMKQFKVQSIKKTATIKEAYTNEELRILLKKPDLKKCKFSELQAWAFCNFLCATGMRLNSAINVKIEDLDFYNNNIAVKITKNRKPLIIPISNALSLVLTEYLRFRKGEPEDYLFCNAYGEKALSRTYQQLVSDYNRRHGVNKTSVHLFRNTFAKNWILNGGDIFRLQKILGHSSLEMVRIYVAMFASDVSTDFDKFNPLDNLGMNKTSGKIKIK